jgi:hypothetical protein
MTFFYKPARVVAGAIAAGALLLGMAVHEARAAEATITAVFEQTQFNPGHNKFVNTTRPSHWCALNPGLCTDSRVFVDLLGFGIMYGALPKGMVGPEFRFPSDFVPVSVRHDATGDVQEVQMKVTNFAAQYISRDNLQTLTGATYAVDAHGFAWIGVNPRELNNWNYTPPGSCTSLFPTKYSTNPYTFDFIWRTPSSSSLSCAVTPAYDLSVGFRIDRMAIGYEMITPNPLVMKSGTYRGTLTYYTDGRSPGFYFGSVVGTKPPIEIDFVLTLRHAFQLTIPPGGDRAVLAPPGGWDQWLNRGRPPTTLQRDLPFGLEAGGGFTMTLRCDEGTPVGRRCMINNGRGSEVPLDVSVTIPGLRTDAGAPVNRLSLLEGLAVATQPDHYINNPRSMLHFEVGQTGVNEMVRHPGTKYQGAVTVVFDALP